MKKFWLVLLAVCILFLSGVARASDTNLDTQAPPDDPPTSDEPSTFFDDTKQNSQLTGQENYLLKAKKKAANSNDGVLVAEGAQEGRN